MATMKQFLAAMVVCTATGTHAQTNYETIVTDFEIISGNWSGSLTYLDYSSGKPYTMPADIVITRIDKTYQFAFSHKYPDEPRANSIDTLTISPDGTRIDNALIISRHVLPNGDIEITTEETGTDGNDNRPATFRHTYTLGKNTFKSRKDVQFSGESTWINRHEYTYTRVPGK